jgi:pimeloyl-ACP methyl ester carboxylesterase
VSATGRERHWQANGLTLVGLEWGEEGAPPVLALHGWLDNAASFSRLAPLLTGRHVIALDLTGHGRSDRRSPDAGYQIWDDLPELLAVVDELGWEQFDLVGHSRGAIISALFAAALPERVGRLVMLDALMPPPVKEAAFPLQLRRHLLDKRRLLRQPDRLYAQPEDVFAAREAVGLGEAAARTIAERNIAPRGSEYAWTTDPRLRGASAVKLTAGQARAVLGALSMPALLLLAEGGYGGSGELLQMARTWLPDAVLDIVPGGHHFHLEGDVNAVGRRIVQFLERTV